MLCTNEAGETTHIHTAQAVQSVPSKRSAVLAFDKLCGELGVGQAQRLEPEIDVISDFLKSR